LGLYPLRCCDLRAADEHALHRTRRACGGADLEPWERCERLVTEAVSVGGEFWVAENPDLRVWGEFSAEPGKKPEVRLAGRLVADPRVIPIQGGVAYSAFAADSVKAFQPITLQGQLETGATSPRWLSQYG
jgi:hypothetical protein